MGPAALFEPRSHASGAERRHRPGVPAAPSRHRLLWPQPFWLRAPPAASARLPPVLIPLARSAPSRLRSRGLAAVRHPPLPRRGPPGRCLAEAWPQAPVPSRAGAAGDEHPAGPEAPPRRGHPAAPLAAEFPLACGLPPPQAGAVGAALERWGSLRSRAEALQPALRREGRLVQEILDGVLGGEDRGTLRRLASGCGREAQAVARQVAASIGGDGERLRGILAQNQRELLELSAMAAPESRRGLLAEMDAVLDELRRAQDAVHGQLLAAKGEADMAAVRSAGRSLNGLKALTKRLDGEKRGLTKNSALAALLITVCRRVLPVRQVDPSALRAPPPSYGGYLQILDFYFFSDASRFCFGEHFSGPNWFTRLKRNIAILTVKNASGRSVYDGFGEVCRERGAQDSRRAAGAPPGPPALHRGRGPDEHGRVFDRRHDAEFKLLTGLCAAVQAESGGCGAPVAAWAATATLWSKKPLCRSCAGAVRQVQGRFPLLKLEVVVGESDTVRTADLPKEDPPGGGAGGLAPAETEPRERRPPGAG
ncbi:unnamed protein product [Prorocentrum cordatum]|uniref:Uncharacterized protein n=2 Tax=Prorocentrum cordatum TaxID=2364126 RepID=A0ABN9PYB6_9DINO|nr:unnamed protein product [Polarella glacialis]